MSHYPRQDQHPHQALHNIVGGPASSWLVEDPAHSGFPGDATITTNNNTMWTSLLHMMTYMVLVTVLMVWAGKLYLRHQHRQQQQHGHTEEVIFVLGIPLLIPTSSTSGMASPRSRSDRQASPVTGGSSDGHAV